MIIPTYYIPIGGTHSWDEDEKKFQWWENGSPLTNFLKGMNLYVHPACPFEWATNLDGDLFRRSYTIWKAAAKHLKCHLKDVPLHERNLICHSHGGQVALIATLYGVEINNLLTIGTPYRTNIVPDRTKIKFWAHICDKKWDLMGFLGAIGDGKVHLARTHPTADKNLLYEKIDHSDILNKPELFKMWDEQKWAKILAYGPNYELSDIG